MIPDEAVEAAARAHFNSHPGYEWSTLSADLRFAYTENMRAALEAAAVHIINHYINQRGTK